MLATHSFILNIGSLRMLMTRPGQPLFNVEWWILTMVGDIDLLTCALLILALPLLALRKSAGWWLAVIRRVATLFLLLFPLFRRRLIAEALLASTSS